MLSDFGLSKYVHFSGIAGQDRLYHKIRPPESYKTDQFSIAIDIYQVGITIYQMINGREEFERQFLTYGDWRNFDFKRFKFDIMTGKFPCRKTIPEHIPARLKNLVKKCLDPEMNNRPDSVMEIMNQLSLLEGNSLDWSLETKTDEKIWTKNNDNGECVFIVRSDGSFEAKKKTPSGSFRKISKFCGNLIGKRTIRDFFKEN